MRAGSEPSEQRRGGRSTPPNAAAVLRETTAGRIHRDLRADIVGLRRRPGEPISEKAIAAAYGVSRTPVREALLRLAEERLVEIFPQSGTFVARIPLAAIEEVLVVRKALEESMARMAAERGDENRYAAIAATIDRQREAAASGDRDRFHEQDEAFHAAVAEAAGYPGVWTLVQTVKTQVDRYRRLTLPVPGRMTAVIAEHENVLAAIRTRDPDKAAGAMAEHLTALMTFADAAGIDPDYLLDVPEQFTKAAE